MNTSTSHTPSSVMVPGAMSPPADDPGLDIGHYLNTLLAYKWLIAAVTVIVLGIGLAIAVLTRPVYESNILIQVEDQSGAGAGNSVLAEVGSLFDIKTAASAEMEIIRSRMIIGQAVEATRLYVDAHPRYVPLIGGWLARRARTLSEPGFLGLQGYVSGTERISVGRLDVPPALENSSFIVQAQGEGGYTLMRDGWSEPVTGTVGTLLKAQTPQGGLALMIDVLDGKPGAQFVINRSSKLSTIGSLQQRLNLVERGKQSGVISASLQDTDPGKLANILNAIGTEYVQQNVERKAAEAQKTLSFLDVQLPEYKRQLEASEERYNRYRNQKGTVAFDEEARLILAQAVDRQTKLLETQQRRRELESRFTSEHPTMQTLDAQTRALEREIGDIQARIKALPAIQQDAVRMERDLTVNTTLYQSLLNSALQLRLVKEGKVGNVRVLDSATVPEWPIKPQRKRILGMALLLGLFLGVLAALVRSFFVEQRITDPHDVESEIALPVFSSIPVSAAQEQIAARRLTGVSGVRLLAVDHPDDPAIESLRSLRTAMQFAMLEATDNRVMITGPTPGVGKSFITANFAALMASAGKRTLLVDADMRRGHLHQYLGLQRYGGLSELIAGSLTVPQTVHRQVLSNLDFLATGQLPPNPAELLVSESFRSVVEQLSVDYDLVVIDAPPVLVASDAGTLARHAATVLLVARAEMSTISELRESTRRLSLSGKAATGVLLNGMNAARRGYRSYKDGRYRYTNYNYESILPEQS